MTSQPSVSIAVINYNGRATLEPTIAAIRAQQGISLSDIRLVDNNSSDGSVEFAQTKFPSLAITRLPANHGPNPARNMGLRLAASDYVLIMDNDIVLAPDYISRLLAVHSSDPAAGAVTGQIRFHDRPETIQYNGTFIHYAGEIMLNREASDRPLRVGCVSAGAVLLDRRKVVRIGGFDEDFFIGWEDGDLTFRLALAGFPCYAVSRAVCYHIRRARGPKWVRYQTRNRWWFIGKNYAARTFFLALPAILLLQCCAFFFCLFRGQALAFGRGALEALAGLPALIRKRRAVQSIRQVGDARLLCGERIDLPGGLEKSGPGRRLMQLLSFVFRLYWRLIRPLLKG